MVLLIEKEPAPPFFPARGSHQTPVRPVVLRRDPDIHLPE